MNAGLTEPLQSLDEVLARGRPKPRAASNAWGINVLLVDDDLADATLILDALRRHPSVSLAAAIHDSEQALRELREDRRRPDLILLDINMPRLNGFKFIEALGEIREMRQTPVVLLTTSRFCRDVEQARATMACAYIVKPESFDDLRRRLDAAVKQTISGKWS